MTGLRAVNGRAGRRRADCQRGRPVLGVCVGMQILFARGVEFGVESVGCGQLAGRGDPAGRAGDPAHGVERGRSRSRAVHSSKAWTPTRGSISCTPTPRSGGKATSEALLTWATHGVPFLAAVEDGPLAATQFHPEKSGDAGAAVLSNWVEGL